MSLKNVDSHNRWRSKTVAFRMSPEEASQLDVNVKLSGLTKQDYLIRRSLKQEIKVIGNPRVYKALKNQMKEILKELERISESKMEWVGKMNNIANRAREVIDERIVYIVL